MRGKKFSRRLPGVTSEPGQETPGLSQRFRSAFGTQNVAFVECSTNTYRHNVTSLLGFNDNALIQKLV